MSVFLSLKYSQFDCMFMQFARNIEMIHVYPFLIGIIFISIALAIVSILFSWKNTIHRVNFWDLYGGLRVRLIEKDHADNGNKNWFKHSSKSISVLKISKSFWLRRPFYTIDNKFFVIPVKSKPVPKGKNLMYVHLMDPVPNIRPGLSRPPAIIPTFFQALRYSFATLFFDFSDARFSPLGIAIVRSLQLILPVSICMYFVNQFPHFYLIPFSIICGWIITFPIQSNLRRRPLALSYLPGEERLNISSNCEFDLTAEETAVVCKFAATRRRWESRFLLVVAGPLLLISAFTLVLVLGRELLNGKNGESSWIIHLEGSAYFHQHETDIVNYTSMASLLCSLVLRPLFLTSLHTIQATMKSAPSPLRITPAAAALRNGKDPLLKPLALERDEHPDAFFGNIATAARYAPSGYSSSGVRDGDVITPQMNILTDNIIEVDNFVDMHDFKSDSVEQKFQVDLEDANLHKEYDGQVGNSNQEKQTMSTSLVENTLLSLPLLPATNSSVESNVLFSLSKHPLSRSQQRSQHTPTLRTFADFPTQQLWSTSLPTGVRIPPFPLGRFHAAFVASLLADSLSNAEEERLKSPTVRIPLDIITLKTEDDDSIDDESQQNASAPIILKETKKTTPETTTIVATTGSFPKNALNHKIVSFTRIAVQAIPPPPTTKLSVEPSPVQAENDDHSSNQLSVNTSMKKVIPRFYPLHPLANPSRLVPSPLSTPSLPPGLSVYYDWDVVGETGIVQLISPELYHRQKGIAADMLKKASRFIFEGQFHNIPMPIRMFEPRSTLMRLAFTFSHAPVTLTRAALLPPRREFDKERLGLCASFLLGQMTKQIAQLKPFTSMIGETYQTCFEDGSKVYFEQTSNQPSTVSFYIDGPPSNESDHNSSPLYFLYGIAEASGNVGRFANSLKVLMWSPVTIVFPAAKYSVVVNRPYSNVGNIIFGSKREFYVSNSCVMVDTSGLRLDLHLDDTKHRSCGEIINAPIFIDAKLKAKLNKLDWLSGSKKAAEGFPPAHFFANDKYIVKPYPQPSSVPSLTPAFSEWIQSEKIDESPYAAVFAPVTSIYYEPFSDMEKFLKPIGTFSGHWLRGYILDGKKSLYTILDTIKEGSAVKDPKVNAAAHPSLAYYHSTMCMSRESMHGRYIINEVDGDRLLPTDSMFKPEISWLMEAVKHPLMKKETLEIYNKDYAQNAEMWRDHWEELMKKDRSNRMMARKSKYLPPLPYG